MKLLKVNHVITGIKGMLTDLVDNGVISDPEARSLLSPLVLHTIRHDNIDIPEEEQ